MPRSRSRFRVIRVALWLSLAVLAGCATAPGPIVNHETVLPLDAAQKAALAKVREQPYRVQRGDELAVYFLHSDTYKQPGVLVLPDGSANFVGIDRVEIAGHTLAWVDSVLTAGYADKLRDPALSVVVNKTAGLLVYVLGNVKAPGAYNIPSQGLGIVGAIAMAGGYEYGAASGSVALVRVSPDGYLCREMNLGSLQKGERLDAAVFDLQPYDIIFVPRSPIGDFVAFSQEVVGSLARYTGGILDVRQIQNPQLYRR